MQVFHSLEGYARGAWTVATIGTFDGVHRAHQALVAHMRALATPPGSELTLLSFDPHPRMVLRPHDHGLQLLHTPAEKADALARAGIDKLLLLPFTPAFAALDAAAFVRQVLVEGMGAQHVVIGHDHHFGKNRQGDVAELQALGRAFGFGVTQMPALLHADGQPISSTRIRDALTAGEVAEAAHMLGYPYGFAGTVIHGQKQGRLMGFPTANLQPEAPLKCMPANGVYLVQTTLPDASRRWGLMNVGHKPTVGDFPRGYEVWLMDFEGDLYGQRLHTAFVHRLRWERKFPDLEALIGTMHHDVAHARAYIQRHQLSL